MTDKYIDFQNALAIALASGGSGGSSGMINYSTDEQVIGTWIDGKPLYQKTIDCGYLPNKGSSKIALGIENIEAIYHSEAQMLDYAGTSAPVPYVTNSTDNVFYWFELPNVTIMTVSDRRTLKCYLTLRYTKTTD